MYLCIHNSFVLDGWPLTKSHVDLLTKFKIIPVLVIELQISDEEMIIWSITLSSNLFVAKFGVE